MYRLENANLVYTCNKYLHLRREEGKWSEGNRENRIKSKGKSVSFQSEKSTGFGQVAPLAYLAFLTEFQRQRD
jgi:hypothetical protein